ncbi:hypothetical protein D3C87_583800 [compost metagenome]
MKVFLKKYWVEFSFITLIWIGYGFMVYSDPNAIIGIFFPLGLTAMGADLMENRTDI